MTSRIVGLLSITCAAGALPLLAAPAGAQECENDGDCPKNYACEVESEVDCAYACPEGEKCTVPDDCVTQEIKGCVAQPCTSDDQCEQGMVCHSETYEQCSGGSMVDCPPDVPCPEPEPAQCETVTETACTPKYMVPCQQDADCGEGFTCVELMECWCSGSGGAGGSSGTAGAGGGVPVDAGVADGGAAEPQSGGPEDAPAPVADAGPPVRTEEECGCSPTGQYVCEMQEIACESETECPAGWTCEANPATAVSCTVPEGAGDAGCVTEPAVVSKACLPPFSDLMEAGRMWDTWGGATLEGGEAAKADSADGAPQTVDQDAADAGVTDLSEPGEAAPGGAEASKSQGGGDGGCSVASVGAPITGSALTWLTGLLGLLALRRRRG